MRDWNEMSWSIISFNLGKVWFSSFFQNFLEFLRWNASCIDYELFSNITGQSKNEKEQAVVWAPVTWKSKAKT